MTKKVAMKAKPTPPAAAAAEADAWVTKIQPTPTPVEAEVEKEPMKRLTIDIPELLHRAVKAGCAQEGVKIADVVRELLTQKYGKP